MKDVYCKVRKASLKWLEEMSNQERLFASDDGGYAEMNHIYNDTWMLHAIKDQMDSGELYVLTSAKRSNPACL